ncbi:MAG TPA: ABC transporter substrate-binding protein [Acetobacteraceae bacterium]|nr:ABC transporter substrate-binding protein [Acetobacteraceae bacterium]
MKRRAFLAGAATGAAGLAAGVTPAWSFEQMGGRRTLVFSGGQPVPVLDPHVKYDWSTRMMQQSIYDALTKYEGNPPHVVPWLAEKWETGPDGLTWTFHLAGNAKFHNGDPLDAEAVRFSYERALKLNKGVAWMLKDHLKPEAIKVVDPRTIQFTLTVPYPAFITFTPLWYIVNPKQVVANTVNDDYGQKFLTDGDAGSGPFKIQRWDGQAVMALEAVPDYWKGWPMGAASRPGGVIYRVIREPAPRKAALERREVDMVTEMTPDDYDELAKMPGIVVPAFTGMTPFTIQMNTQNGPTADLNFRKAMAYAFDYHALLQIENNAAKLMDSPFPNAMTGHVAIPDMPQRNLDLAKQYLAKTKTPQGGIEITYLYVAGLEVERRIGLAVLDSLQPLNIKVNVAAQPWPTLVARGAKPETTPEMVAVYVTPVSTDPDVIAAQYASTAEGQFWHMHHLNDTDLDGMIVKARLETDQAQRMKIYAAIQHRIVALQPCIFGMLEDRKWAMRNYVKGFQFCPVRLTGEADLYTLYAATA